MTLEQQKFSDIKHTTDYKTIGEDIDYKVFVDEVNKEVVLQFRETNSRQDWKHNFQFLPWPLKLGRTIVWTTRGYALAYKSAQNIPITEFLYKRQPGYKGCIRGWSFGSAMAKIAARHLECIEWTVDELTTFGDVKCWVNPFYRPKNIERIREYTTPNDFVTYCVPFYHRDKKCKVGDHFSLKKIFKTEYYHTHYEEYDYTKWED